MMGRIDLLYYSNAFLASHGGRLHSEAFLKEARKNERVNEITIYPEPSTPVKSEHKRRHRIREFLKSRSVLQVLFFYRRNYKSFKEIVPVLRQRKVDCIHIRLDSNFLIIEKLRNLFPALIITTEINASPFDENFGNIAFSGYFRRLERTCLKRAHANFFVSDFLRNSIMRDAADTRDFVIHNGVDLEIFNVNASKPVRPKDVITLGYVGTIDYHKNLEILIDAFDQVLRTLSSPRIRLLIVGDGPMLNELKSYIAEKGISEFIECVGWVKHENIVRYLNRMDIAIHHTANRYMSPLKIFEYMAVGLPVIGPDIPAIREILEDGTDLLLVRSEVEDIANKITYLIEHDEKRQRIAMVGCEKIRSRFGWKNNVDKILGVMYDLSVQVG